MNTSEYLLNFNHSRRLPNLAGRTVKSMVLRMSHYRRAFTRVAKKGNSSVTYMYTSYVTFYLHFYMFHMTLHSFWKQYIYIYIFGPLDWQLWIYSVSRLSNICLYYLRIYISIYIGVICIFKAVKLSTYSFLLFYNAQNTKANAKRLSSKNVSMVLLRCSSII